MSTRIPAPPIDTRTAAALVKRLRAMAPHYTPEWAAKDDDDPGIALMQAFAFLSEGVINRLNRAPDRNFYAFLDMLGIRLLPAVPARGPVRFLVSNGAPDVIDVEAGTQLSASSAGPPPVPFETDEDLRVVAANLAALVAADPLTDSIYIPPPGFLTLSTVAEPLPLHTVQAFSSAGSNTFQLDFADQLQPGDVLRILETGGGSGVCTGFTTGSATTSTGPDYLVVSAVKGSLVTLNDPLVRDYTEGTSVEKVTTFSLLEGRNQQQHIVYLAHSDYFNIKSEATFTLFVTKAAGSASGLQALQIAWEFWGATKTSPADGWQPFQVQGDGTTGLSSSGNIQLLKPEGEIKQVAINGVKSRWIRARLINPLPATPPPAIPRVDSIQLQVSSAADGIAPDLAFNNDTPLSLNQPFPPFGFEPRTFDRFYLASAEAFSKPGAAVDIKVTLDITELLGSPVAVTLGGKLQAFAHGAGGVLTEFDIDPLSTNQTAPPISHGQPLSTRMTAGSIPAASVEPFGRIAVVVRGDDANLYLRWIQGTDNAIWQWIPLKNPGGSKLQFDPGIVYFGGLWQVFAVMDGKVYGKFVVPPAPLVPLNWVLLGTPTFTAASTPFATTAGNVLSVVVFDSTGHTWNWNGTTWTDITPTGVSAAQLSSFLAAPGCRPWAQLFGTEIRVFLRNTANQLAVFDTVSRSEIWGAPEGVTLQSSPVAYAGNPSNLSTVRVFVRGSGDVLCEAVSTPAATPPSTWVTHDPPFPSNLALEPYLLAYSAATSAAQPFFSVLSVTDKNTLLEYRSAQAGAVSGSLTAGPLELIPLHSSTDLTSSPEIVLLDGPDRGKILKIQGSDPKSRFGRLTPALSQPVDSGTPYQLLTLEESDVISAPTASTVTLKSNSAVQRGDYLQVGSGNSQVREVSSVSNDTATVDPDWDSPLPHAGDAYHLYTPVGSQQAAGDNAAVTVLLDTAAGTANHQYDNQYLQLSPGANSVPQPVKISQYIGVDRAAILASLPPSGPLSGVPYQITSAPFPQAWFEFHDLDQTALRPQLSWEYWNGTGWVNLPGLTDTTSNLLVAGEIDFTLPDDIAATEVAGQKNSWIRARIIGGDYGTATFVPDPAQPQQLVLSKDAIRPPSIQALTINYKVTQNQYPQACVTLNNLDWLDQTAANQVADKYFLPFVPLPVTEQALFFGFDQPFEGGPVRLYLAAAELAVDETAPSKLAWEYASANDWKPLTSTDDTAALTKPDRVSLSVAPGWQQRQQFGQSLSWLRGRLASGSWPSTPVLSGVFPNTCWALQVRTYLNEILGSGTASATDTFHFSHVPVLEGEEVRVRESLTDDERTQLIAAEGEDSVFVVTDNQGKPVETWVLWKEVIEFYAATGGDRVYRVDRADGEIQFGDGIHGKLLPIGGDNVVAFSYRAGGGTQGNVAAGQVDSLVTAVAGIQSVINPDGFGGGCEDATPEQMLVFGPAEIANRERAVTPGDFESLALEASRQVRKARCVPNQNASQRGETGWVSIYIVPDSTDPQPTPTLQLRRTVSQYLEDRVVVTVADQQRIFVGPPNYVVVSVEATVYATSLDVIGEAENAVHQTLETFLHPLTGGPDAGGWDFGRELAASDLYAVLEGIDTVDHVGTITLSFNGQTSTDRVTVGANQLLAGGEHAITMAVGAGS